MLALCATELRATISTCMMLEFACLTPCGVVSESVLTFFTSSNPSGWVFPTQMEPKSPRCFFPLVSVCPSGIQRMQLYSTLFDVTDDPSKCKSFSPWVQSSKMHRHVVSDSGLLRWSFTSCICHHLPILDIVTSFQHEREKIRTFYGPSAVSYLHAWCNTIIVFE